MWGPFGAPQTPIGRAHDPSKIQFNISASTSSSTLSVGASNFDVRAPTRPIQDTIQHFGLELVLNTVGGNYRCLSCSCPMGKRRFSASFFQHVLKMNFRSALSLFLFFVGPCGAKRSVNNEFFDFLFLFLRGRVHSENSFLKHVGKNWPKIGVCPLVLVH